MIQNSQNSEIFFNELLFEEYDEIDTAYRFNPDNGFTFNSEFEIDTQIQYPVSPSFRIMKGNMSIDNNPYELEAKKDECNYLSKQKITASNIIKENAAETNPSCAFGAIQSIDFDQVRMKNLTEVLDPQDSGISDFNSCLAIADEPTKEDKVILAQKQNTVAYKSKLRGGEERESLIATLNTIEPFHFHERRWGKEEDRSLYKLLLELESNNIINIADVSKASVSKECKSILKIISRKCGWIGPYSLFHRRIKNMLKQSHFSARELILLKRILRKEFKFANLNYESIAARFPGKSIPYLVETCERIISERQ